MSSKLRRNLLISGYLRDNKFEELVQNVIPNGVISIIEQYYPIYIAFNESKLGLTTNEKQTLTQYLTNVLIDDKHKSYILSEKLLYDGYRDGFNAKSFHS